MTEKKKMPANEVAFMLLRELFTELEREIADLGLGCAKCGQCCHFDEAEHVLFATGLEIDYLFATAGQRQAQAQGRCPYQQGAICLARESRPLGCRLYFCRADTEKAERLASISAYSHARLRAIHDETGISYAYAPFLEQLACPEKR